jgi:hypothetical protein
MLWFLLPGGLQILEDVSTWKLIKQFHLRANAIRHITNVKWRYLLTFPHAHGSVQNVEYVRGFSAEGVVVLMP